jgi:Domain of unknown function (DUF4167)
MRPNNQNKRSRNRNGGRKHSNPLSRNFESNGPDVKIRGNAAHVAEKYVQLARDATASGDLVTAENYFQHAEHYFRILSAAQALNPQQRNDQPSYDNGSDDDDDEDDISANPPQRSEQPAPAQTVNGNGNGNGAASHESNGSAPVRAHGDGDGDQKGRGERRQRRRPRPSADAGSDPAEAPQPDVGSLPAFLTGGTPTGGSDQ